MIKFFSDGEVYYCADGEKTYKLNECDEWEPLSGTLQMLAKNVQWLRDVSSLEVPVPFIKPTDGGYKKMFY